MDSTDPQAASAVNRELTDLLCLAGERFGFGVVREYPVRGGRLDVVWMWSPPTPVPGLDTVVPVVEFEVESSWRTRKHVKGDLLNLQDAGVGLGVIVLAGDGEKDFSLRKFAELLVDRPGPRILIWTADDVRALGTPTDAPASTQQPDAEPDSDRQPRDLTAAVADPLVVPAVASATLAGSHAGKYAPLYRWLRRQPGPTLKATFGDVEEVLGFPLPASCRTHLPHWYGHQGSAVARAIIDAGWKASAVNIEHETLVFVRVTDT